MNKISRRDFLKYVGAGGVGAGAGVMLGESSKRTVELLMPQVVAPEDYSPGIATWYNTVCRQCPAGCGISVRTREGRAKKIEGNPLHPVNQGRLCSLGQAGLNALYNPDRIKTPLKRTGERGTNQFTPISWDEALTTLGSRLGNIKIQNKGDRVFLLTDCLRGHTDTLFSTFMQALGSDNYLHYDFTSPINHYLANEICFDVQILPYYDISNTDFLLSFGADYLGTWLSPVHYSLSYGELRQGNNGKRGKCVQVEPRMTLSGANADEWIQAKPGSEGLLALAIANHLVEQGAYTGPDREQWLEVLAPYSPANVATATDVAPDRINKIAQAFAAARSPLAIAGGPAAASTNSLANLVAVNALNYLAGNIGKKGGVIFNPEPVYDSGAGQRRASFRRMLELTDKMQGNEVDVLLIHNTNPVFTLPSSSKFHEAIKNIPTIVSLSSFMDETTVMSDLVLPTDTYLESWGDDMPEHEVGFSIASVSQPVVSRIYDTRSGSDIILALAHQIGSEVAVALPWTDNESYLKDSWEKIYRERTAFSDLQGFNNFWNYALTSGVWGEDRPKPEKDMTQLGQNMLNAINIKPPAFAGGDSDYPFMLYPVQTQAFLDGRGANLPWVQELPDPMTSIVYNSWVELNPETANQLGVREGDVIKVESVAGTLQAPAFIYHGIRPDVIAIPVGQGHTQYGRYAKDRGVNPIQILAPEMDQESGALAWAATRVKVSKTGKHVNLIKTDGVTRTLGRQILSDKPAHGNMVKKHG